MHDEAEKSSLIAEYRSILPRERARARPFFPVLFPRNVAIYRVAAAREPCVSLLVGHRTGERKRERETEESKADRVPITGVEREDPYDNDENVGDSDDGDHQ